MLLRGVDVAEPAKFLVEWGEADVEAQLARVRAYPFPRTPMVEDGWAYGCDAQFLKDICAYWTSAYDWRAAVAELNRFPQYTIEIDGLDIHYVHLVGEAAGKRPLILVHGWPGSHFEFWRAAERLAFPSRFGGSPADAFDLVIPSLPGFGFSGKPDRPIGQQQTAAMFNALMTRVLGYERYFAQGGDWGALVVSWLGHDYPQTVAALHLNMMAFRPPVNPQTEDERRFVAQSRKAIAWFGAYQHLQRTRPQSVAWLAAGNPVGQAAWILERFHDWVDLGGRELTDVISRDHLLTNVMLYVMTDSFTTGAWYYRGLIEEGGLAFAPGERVETPTAFADFPGEPQVKSPPESWIAGAYNLVRHSKMERGGHFAAMEQPEAFADDVAAFFREQSLTPR